MTTTLLSAEHTPVRTPAEHFHGTLPPVVMAALLPHALVPAEIPFEAWEDGAYVLAYLRQSGLR